MAAAAKIVAPEAEPNVSAGDQDTRPSESGRVVAYVMSRFPKLTETFVLDEILALERRGIRVEVFPLWREKAKVIHPEARAVVDRAHFLPTLDLEILADNALALIEEPRRYLGTLLRVLWSNRKSPRFLAGAAAIFPKAVSFARRMRALGVDHVHAHFASHPAAAAFIVGRLIDLPWSFTAHGSDLHREQSMLKEKVAEAAFTVTISDYNRRFILDRVPAAAAAQVKVIHCGVEPDRFKKNDRDSEIFEFACVGTLHAVKGQGPLLEACGQLRSQGIAFRCHLVGDGPDRDALTAQTAELGISEHVEFHGALAREEVRAVLARMDAAIAPSVPTRDGRREGIPVVLMEAAASGLPLIGSRLSGIPEIVEDEATGLLVEPGNVSEIAAALERLARDEALRDRLGRAARTCVEESFSLERNIDELVEAFYSDPDAKPPAEAS